MSTQGPRILAYLAEVTAERMKRSADPTLRARVSAIKSYQRRRFALTYDDLLKSPRYGAAARFFLDELYGEGDSQRRDAQFSRVVPALVRLFPTEIVETVATLAQLHGLSERLDSAMAAALPSDVVGGVDYLRAWQSVDRAVDRRSQLNSTVDVATRLDRFTQRILLRNSLRLMRGPAHAAGLGELQEFLEGGFDTFRAMGGAAAFTRTLDVRETAFAAALDAADPDHLDAPATRLALGMLP